MSLREVLMSLIRRWYLTLAGLLLTGGLVVAALALVPPSWQSTASIVLLPPRASVPPGGNPYLELGGLAPTLDLLVASLDDQQTRLSIEQLNPMSDYTVRADRSSSGPVLLIEAQDSSPEGANAVRDDLLNRSVEKLEVLQSDLSIPTRAQITSSVLTIDEQPELAGKDRIRAVVVAVGAGLVGTAVFVSLIDGLMLRRRGDADGPVGGGQEHMDPLDGEGSNDGPGDRLEDAGTVEFSEDAPEVADLSTGRQVANSPEEDAEPTLAGDIGRSSSEDGSRSSRV